MKTLNMTKSLALNIAKGIVILPSALASLLLLLAVAALKGLQQLLRPALTAMLKALGWAVEPIDRMADFIEA